MPFAVVHLMDVANLFQCRNALVHNRSFVRAVVDFFYADRARTASVNDALVILDGNELSFIVKNRPVFLEQTVDLLLNVCGEVQEIKELAQCCAMISLIVFDKKIEINLIKRWGWMLAFAQDCAAIYVMENHVKFM